MTPLLPEETRHERAIRASISIHCPGLSAFQMACRADIAAMRDQAAVAMFRAAAPAAALLGVVARLASTVVYAPAADGELLNIRVALRMTIDAAGALDRASGDGSWHGPL